MSIACAYPSHADARKAGWFSRRHQTDAAHREEQYHYRETREAKSERERDAHEHAMLRKSLERRIP